MHVEAAKRIVQGDAGEQQQIRSRVAASADEVENRARRVEMVFEKDGAHAGGVGVGYLLEVVELAVHDRWPAVAVEVDGPVQQCVDEVRAAERLIAGGHDRLSYRWSRSGPAGSAVVSRLTLRASTPAWWDFTL